MSSYIWTWGLNDFGQLGNGTNTSSNVPVQVDQSDMGTNVCSITKGDFHCLALMSNGEIWSWGNNQFGQLGNGTNINSNVPVQVDQSDMGTNICAISAGKYHNLALTIDGNIWSWGANFNGSLGNGTNTNSNVPVQVDQSDMGTNICAIAGLTGIDGSSLALTLDGQIWSWGYNGAGQLGDGTNTSSNVPVQVDQGIMGTNICSIFGGSDNGFALMSNGQVWSWGGGNFGQLGNGTNIGSSVPVQVDQSNMGTNICAISAGLPFALALTSDGEIWGWGGNFNGQLGNGTNINSNVPVQVEQGNMGTNICAIAGTFGEDGSSFALTADGELWSWGYNGDGQLGNGTNTNSSVPVQVDQSNMGTNVCAISVIGFNFAAVLVCELSISCPPDITIISAIPTSVNYNNPTVDDDCFEVQCTLEDGTIIDQAYVFPLGSTIVTVNAISKSCGNACQECPMCQKCSPNESCSFNVTVLAPTTTSRPTTSEPTTTSGPTTTLAPSQVPTQTIEVTQISDWTIISTNATLTVNIPDATTFTDDENTLN